MRLYLRMGELDDSTRDDTLLQALAWTPKVAPFVGTARYQVRACLGEGGFGVVYEVEDRELGRHVALKTLKPQRAGFATSIQRLKREFRSVADLAHHNLVGLHELSSDGGRWFFTMELVRGLTLLDYVRGGDPTHVEARLRACLHQLVAGVAALHDAGIIHRDLKPSNVLVEADGRAVILDFGLADGDEPLDPELALAGTPSYMAPEQAAGAAVTPAADWYAVGVMMHEALVGDLASIGGEVPGELGPLCRALLQREPDRRPGPVEISAMLGAPPDATRREPPRRSRSRRVVGRAAERTALAAGLAAVSHGEPTLIRICGQPGVGKTALLDDFLASVRSDGRAVVLSGRCYEREAVPFKAFDGVVDRLAEYLNGLPRNEATGLMARDIHLAAQLFPVLDGVASVRDVPRRQVAIPDPRAARARAFAAIKELLARISDKQPLVIAIDDLQWSDVDSARLLSQLVTPPDRPAVMVVLAYRDEVADNPTLRDTLDTLTRTGSAGSELTLAPLPTCDAEELAAMLLSELGRAASPAAARMLAERGEGHPLYITELARAQVHADAAPGAPSSLLELLWQRVLRLSAGARALLETIAVAGQPLPRDLCFEAAALGPAGIDAVRVLRAEQFVRAGDRGHLNVFHDRVRDAVLFHADAGTQRERHLALARSLELQPDQDLEALARHYDAADEAEPAARYAVQAGDRAMTALAFERAAALFRTAIERGGAGDASAALHEKLGHALLHAGRSVAAGEAFLAAAARVESGPEKTELLRLAAEHLLVVGDPERGQPAVEQALAAVGERLPRSNVQAIRMVLAGMILLRLRRSRFRERPAAEIPREELLRLDVLDSAVKGLTATDPMRAFALSARFYRCAAAVGEPRRAARAFVGWAMCTLPYAKAMPELAIELLDLADAVGERLGDPALLGRSLATRGMLHFAFNDWAQAAEINERAAALIAERCRGMPSEQHDALLIAATSRVRAGQFERARRLGEALRLGAIERGDVVYQKQVSAGVLAPLHLVDDDPDAAERLLVAVGDEPRCPSVVLRADATASIALYRGRPRAAIESWRRLWSDVVGMGVMMMTGLRTWVVRSLATALLAGDPSRRERAEVMRLLKLLRRSRTPAARAVAAMLRAQLALAAGRSADAGTLLLEAARQYELASMPHDAAACRYRRGELIGGADGGVERDAAEASLRALGIAQPARWVAMIVPPVTGGRLLLGHPPDGSSDGAGARRTRDT